MLVSFAAADETGRRAAVLDWRFTEGGPGCMVVDPTPDHWPDLEQSLGPLATRQAALAPGARNSSTSPTTWSLKTRS
jgi:hypothetical protein